jgi:hypothetical protein
MNESAAIPWLVREGTRAPFRFTRANAASDLYELVIDGNWVRRQYERNQQWPAAGTRYFARIVDDRYAVEEDRMPDRRPCTVRSSRADFDGRLDQDRLPAVFIRSTA